MINENIEKMLFEDKDTLVIPVNNMSMVFADNSLLHAIMVLNNTTYTSVPVLDYQYKLVGLISTNQIFKFLGEKINEGFEVLEKYKVADAVDMNFYTVKEHFELEEVIRGLINNNFLCVVDDENVIKGIIPRSSILKRFNYMAHEFDKNYVIKPKNNRFFQGSVLEDEFKNVYSSR